MLHLNVGAALMRTFTSTSATIETCEIVYIPNQEAANEFIEKRAKLDKPYEGIKRYDTDCWYFIGLRRKDL